MAEGYDVVVIGSQPGTTINPNARNRKREAYREEHTAGC